MPDLILLDMKMPVMDGASFASELRRRAPRCPPVVVLTAAADPRKQALEIGAARGIGKPFELDELLEAIEATGT